MADYPRVAVLLASYNGAEWIGEQVESIINNRSVRTHIFLSDDGSSDETVAVAKQYAAGQITVLPLRPTGSAAQNFIRLVMDARWDEFDYVALADQDDIWLPEKLSRAISQIRQKKLSAYSSDVMAFWPDGRQEYIRKSQPLQRWDHLFESAGPGNTFVFPKQDALFLRDMLNRADPAALSAVDRHDWLFYALFREASKPWFIDDVSGLDYRQHEANVVGAAKGLRAKLARLDLIKNGWYRDQILQISYLSGASNTVIDYVKHPKMRQWWKLAIYSRGLRRSLPEALALGVLLAMMAFPRKST